jgi:hypothetical protein
MGLRELAIARLKKLNAQATECPSGTVPSITVVVLL